MFTPISIAEQTRNSNPWKSQLLKRRHEWPEAYCCLVNPDAFWWKFLQTVFGVMDTADVNS